jgi:hypothetical protein
MVAGFFVAEARKVVDAGSASIVDLAKEELLDLF